MRWFMVVGVFLIGNLLVFTGFETILDEHLVAGLALVLLGVLALYAAVLIVMRIKARRTQAVSKEVPPVNARSIPPTLAPSEGTPRAYVIIGGRHKKPPED